MEHKYCYKQTVKIYAFKYLQRFQERQPFISAPIMFSYAMFDIFQRKENTSVRRPY